MLSRQTKPGRRHEGQWVKLRPRVLATEFSPVHLQGSDESFLRDIHFAELPHALLALLLLFEQLALTCHVAAVALSGHVLAKCPHGFSSDDLAANRRLDWNLEHVGWNQLFELFH